MTAYILFFVVCIWDPQSDLLGRCFTVGPIRHADLASCQSAAAQEFAEWLPRGGVVSEITCTARGAAYWPRYNRIKKEPQE